ncbi:MAG: universal stress protein [Planctomycetota bacterium]|jgi:nucleotide-binding universal stress UspA family protein
MDDVKVDRIVCAVDFSENSDYALSYAVQLARTFDAELKLLHVVELPFLPSYALAGVPDLSMPVEQIQQNSRRKLDELLEDCRQRYERTDADLRTGSPFLEIINYAREVDADLIVVGTHGRTGLRHMIIGSVAEKVVRKAPCPVLSIKHPKQEFEMP